MWSDEMISLVGRRNLPNSIVIHRQTTLFPQLGKSPGAVVSLVFISY
jgi:hypothetical protein